MPTVLDEFVVKVGFDLSGLDKAVSDIQKALGGVKVNLKKSGKQIEKSGNEAAASINKLRNQVIGLFAAFTAGRGIKEFVSDITATDAATGRLARTLDMSVRDLTAWQGAAVLLGGSAAGVTGSLSNLTSELQEFSLTGQSSTIPYFRALGIGLVDVNGKLKTAGDLYLDLSKAIESKRIDPARATFLLQAIGADQGSINLILQGTTALAKLLALSKEYAATPQDVAAAQKRQFAWEHLTLAAERMGRTLTTILTPAIVWFTDKLTKASDWFDKHPHWLEVAFGGVAVVATLLSIGVAVTIIGVAVGGLVAAFAFLSGPIGGTIAGILAIIAVATVWYNAWRPILDWFEDKWARIAGLVSSVFGGFATATQQNHDRNVSSGGASGSFAGNDAVAAANAAQSKYGIPASVTLAQYALESGNGKHIPAGSNNPFGIKARAGQPYVEAQTKEYINGQIRTVTARFAKYASLADAFDAHAKLLATSPAYANARKNEGNPSAFANALTGVYATDPNYGSKLNALMAQSGAGAAVNNSSSSSNTSNSSQTSIGTVVVNTQATDAAGIAQDIKPALQRSNFTAQANYGAS